MMQRNEKLVWNQRCGKEAMHGLYWMSSGSRYFSVGTNNSLSLPRVFHSPVLMLIIKNLTTYTAANC